MFRAFFSKKPTTTTKLDTQADSLINKEDAKIAAFVAQGDRLFDLGSYTEAMTWYNHVIAHGPLFREDPTATNTTLKKVKRYYKALKCCDMILELNINHLHSFHVKDRILSELGTAEELDTQGNALFVQGDYEDALACFSTALMLDPTYSRALKNKKLALAHLGKTSTTTSNRIKNKEKTAEEFNVQGDQLYDHRKHEEAVVCYNSTLKLDSNNLHAYFNLGSSLCSLERYKEALECYDNILKLDLKNIAAHHNRGMALEKLKEYRKALNCYDTILQISPKDPLASKHKERILAQLYETYTTTFPNNAKNKETKAALKKVKQKTKTAKEYDDQGDKLYNSNKYEEALACYNNALGLDPKFINAYMNKGRALNKLKKYHEALECFDISLKLDPINVIAHYSKGRILQRLGDYQKALECYENALRIDPEYALALENKKRTLAQLNKTSTATVSDEAQAETKQEATPEAEKLNKKDNSLHIHSSHEKTKTYENTLNQEYKNSAARKEEQAASTLLNEEFKTTASAPLTTRDTEHKVSAVEASTLREEMEDVQQRLNKHSAKIDEHEKILQHINADTLQFLNNYEPQFNAMIEKELQAESKNTYHRHIMQHTHFTAYYIMFFSVLIGVNSACNGIFSGYLANGKKEYADYALDGLDKLSGILPAGSFLMKILTGGATVPRIQKRARFVEKIITFFAKYEKVEDFIRDLAHQLTLIQAETLPELALKSPETFSEKAKGKAFKVKNWLLADGSDDPVKAKAKKDCEKLLKTISEDKKDNFTKAVTVDYCIVTILGDKFKRAPLPQTTSSADASGSDTPTHSTVERMDITETTVDAVDHSAVFSTSRATDVKASEAEEKERLSQKIAELEQKVADMERREREQKEQKAAHDALIKKQLKKLHKKDQQTNNRVSLTEEKLQQIDSANELLFEIGEGGQRQINVSAVEKMSHGFARIEARIYDKDHRQSVHMAMLADRLTRVEETDLLRQMRGKSRQKRCDSTLFQPATASAGAAADAATQAPKAASKIDHRTALLSPSRKSTKRFVVQA